MFDLTCPAAHRFEGWFASSEDFASQQARGLVACPQCGSADIIKAPMAPAVPKKGNQQRAVTAPSAAQAMAGGAPPPQVLEAMQKLAVMQAEALKDSQWVGDRFAEQSRAIHYGEAEAKTIHGQATLQQAKELQDEGIAVAPLPFPVAPPKAIN